MEGRVCQVSKEDVENQVIQVLMDQEDLQGREARMVVFRDVLVKEVFPGRLAVSDQMGIQVSPDPKETEAILVPLVDPADLQKQSSWLKETKEIPDP
ncbi:UNVERIFIED_CONTAM: hypothetical protein K2H54_047155 [Gekko kuhli]